MGFNAARKIFFSSSLRPTTTTRSSASGNSEWLYPGGGYAEILDFLCSPVTGMANVKVLVSEPGLGKTVMLRSAIERMKGEARTAFVFWTQFQPQEFVEHLLSELGSSEPPPTDLKAAQSQFENLLRRAEADGKRLVLAIDDAHNLSTATLRSLSVLLDRDTARPPRLTLLLAGLPSLHDRLADPDASGLRERTAEVRTIEPLNAEQTAEYIRARITAFGGGPVTPRQSANIAAGSGGVLRNIDKLLDELPPKNESWQQRIKDALGVDTPATVLSIPQVDSGANEKPTMRADTPVITRIDTPVNIPIKRAATRADEPSIMTPANVKRIADWARDRPGMWSGTLGELAAATGIAVEEVSDAVENRTQELRRNGIRADVQRLPGRPRMITLSRLEPESALEPEPAPASEASHGQITVTHEEAARPQPKLERQEAATEPARHQEVSRQQQAVVEPEAVLKQESVSETELPWIKAFRESSPLTGSPKDHAQKSLTEPEFHQEVSRPQEAVLKPEAGLNQEPASETGLHWTHTVEEPRSGLAWKAAIVIGAIIVLALAIFYPRAVHSAHQSPANDHRVSQPKQSSEVDEVTGLLTDRQRLASTEQAAAKGDSVAQRRLGLALSLDNNGGAADRVAAYTWLVMAQNGGQTVEKGTMDSLTRSMTPGEMRDVRYRLGTMYEQGVGSVPNLVLADQWYLLGTAVGDARSRARSAQLERRMSPAHISQAHAQSNDWLQRYASKTSDAATR